MKIKLSKYQWNLIGKEGKEGKEKIKKTAQIEDWYNRNTAETTTDPNILRKL